jgi:hypothetical protein
MMSCPYRLLVYLCACLKEDECESLQVLDSIFFRAVAVRYLFKSYCIGQLRRDANKDMCVTNHTLLLYRDGCAVFLGNLSLNPLIAAWGW